MTLTQRREVVRKFKAGKSLHDIAAAVFGLSAPLPHDVAYVSQVLRDYLLGKFTLTAKRKARSRA